jgi:chemotaxis protein CheX
MSEARIILPANLDLLAAAPLKEQIAGHAGANLVLDGSAVERLGAQCLQVLLAARAKWRAEKNQFRIADPSAVFGEHLQVLGAMDLVSEQAVEEVCS